ncbi:MAG: glycosyl hydrolase 43 family protein [Clostridiales bacterium]|nr:glycosyl hydrolase 43 family protein [Clostridiales bacterium]
MRKENPIIYADYPDPDIIRVEDVYYMCTTTMHVFPGGEILRSRDLLHWEHCAYAYDALNEHPGQRLDDGKGIYGQGMWAGCLRHHGGLFHLVFMCNDTHSAYYFTAENAEGPWTRHPMAGFYHDPSILFDDDGRVYIAYGNRDIRITELEADLSAPRPGGLDRLVIHDDCDGLGWEGSHLYKLNGKYYLLGIHWLKGSLRAQGCYVAESLEGDFRGGEILCQPFHGRNDGPAQGGMVQTPQGDWYLMLFQDHGAVGRIPVLVPMRWENDYPVVDGVPAYFEGETVACKPLVESASLRNGLSDVWQWNHEPHGELIHQDKNGLRLTTDRVVSRLPQSVNTLTQRTFGPRCSVEVTVEGGELNDGDFAGLCALQGHFGQIALTREGGSYALAMTTHEGEMARIPWHCASVRLRACFDFETDTVRFFYLDDEWKQLGGAHQLRYMLDHFMGVRAGLFCYSMEKYGGSAVFADFVYTIV